MAGAIPIHNTQYKQLANQKPVFWNISCGLNANAVRKNAAHTNRNGNTAVTIPNTNFFMLNKVLMCY